MLVVPIAVSSLMPGYGSIMSCWMPAVIAYVAGGISCQQQKGASGGTVIK